MSRETLGKIQNLAIAIYKDQDEIANCLLEKGAEVRKALYYSAYWDNIKVFAWLYKKGHAVLAEFDFEGLWASIDKMPTTLLGVAESQREKGAVNSFLNELMKKS